ncbi:beta-sandwich lipoprotein [Anaeromicropila populeti]|uniref:Uncharacterized protein n=1 Tax=Anaeromicropila populeti TaxID=37658 RepID=A0A1I6JEK3_9FIRM|nr:hypothetical protein [Anaeromicropila populeti]SFR77391.1 hypothetical protein SAMN05661086_01617 [Anaeromicropila populeti]
MNKEKVKKIILTISIVSMIGTMLTGCEREADRVSYNVSQQADNFNVIRRLTVINARTDNPIFELIAAFSLKVDQEDNQLEIICETGDGEYKKHFIGLNDWTLYVVEDISGADVNKYHYEVNFLPDMINPITFTNED